MISILILTKNEEQDLPGCLESVKWSDDIHVFDSYSDDKTIEIAEKYGANVSQRKFDNYSNQRNAALDLNYKYQWVFILDADERIPIDLQCIMEYEIAKVSSSTSGFRIRRRDFLGNSWLKYSQISPYYIRLVRVGKAKYHREINEVLELEGEIKDINGYFDHFPFSKGFKHWIEKHNSYSSMEAQRWIDEHNGNFNFSIKKAFFSRDFTEKRFHQKGLFYKLPFRPFMKWSYMMFIRGAFLDGQAGLIYSALQSIYEYFIVIKTRELIDKQD